MNGRGVGMEGKGTELQQRNLWRWWGLCLIIGGVVLLGLAGAYYGYVLYSEAQYAPLTSTGRPPAQDNGPVPALPTERPTQEPTPTATLSATVSPTPTGPGYTVTPAAPTPSASATPTAPTSTPQPTNTPLPPSPAIHIVIRDIDLDAPVLEVNWGQVAKFAVGHYPTANPGERGNIVLAGHNRSDFLNEGDIFNRLWEIGNFIGVTAYQDKVIKTTPSAPRPVYITLYGANGAQYRYLAEEALIIDPNLPVSTWILDPTPDETLTLITCIPEFVYSHRFVVRAKRIQ